MPNQQKKAIFRVDRGNRESLAKGGEFIPHIIPSSVRTMGQAMAQATKYRGLFLILLLAFTAPGLAEECVYPDRREGGLTAHTDCGELAADGEFQLFRKHLRHVDFDSRGLACIYADAKTYYVRRDGRSRRAVNYDNGCDYFVAGLARAYDKNGMVYVDKALDVVLRPNFELLGVFEHGHAMVCNGPFTREQVGEHSIFHGGQCGVIDRQGRQVMPAELAIDDRQKFRNYVNSHNECPPPPIETKASAICHARRHLLAEIYPRQAAKKVLRAVQEPGRWRVSFAWCDRHHCYPEVELDSETAEFHSIVPGKRR